MSISSNFLFIVYPLRSWDDKTFWLFLVEGTEAMRGGQIELLV